jgi:hypothetical protein
LGGFTTIAQLRAYLHAVHPGWSDGAIESFLAEMHVGPDGVVAPRLPQAHHTSIIRSLWEEPVALRAAPVQPSQVRGLDLVPQARSAGSVDNAQPSRSSRISAAFRCTSTLTR